MSGLILGVSAYHRDSAAVLLRDGEIVAAAQEQWFTRMQHETRFPAQAIAYCLQEAQLALADIDCVALSTGSDFESDALLDAGRTQAPRGIGSLLKVVPQWLRETLPLKIGVRRELAALGDVPAKLFWIQSSADDAGGALGAALTVWYEYLEQSRAVPITESLRRDLMRGGNLGPWFASDSIAEYLDSIGAPYKKLGDADFYAELSSALAAEKLVGWFQGRMPFGTHAANTRAIIGDPRSAKMSVAGCRLVAAADPDQRLTGLLNAFAAKTGRRDLTSISFNTPDEPIVCTPADAYRCFMRSEMDCLALENMVLHKREQPLWEEM